MNICHRIDLIIDNLVSEVLNLRAEVAILKNQSSNGKSIKVSRYMFDKWVLENKRLRRLEA